MSSEVNITRYKTLDELSFEDLCVEVPEQTYPALRGVLRSLWARTRRKSSIRHNTNLTQGRKGRARRLSTPRT